MDKNSMNLTDRQINNYLYRLVGAIFITYLTIGMPLPVISLYVHDQLGMDDFWVGLAIGIQFIATVLTRGYAGKLADQQGAKRTTLQGIICGALSGVVYLLAILLPLPVAIKYTILLIGRLILGYSESLLLTGVLSWGFGLAGAQRAGKVMSWNGMAVYGAMAVGAPLGLAIYQQWDFTAIALLTIIMPLLALFLNGPIPTSSIIKGERLPLLSVIGLIMKPGVLLALQGVGFSSIGAFTTLYFAGNHWSNAGFALTCFGVAFVVVRLCFGRLPDKYGGYRIAFISLLVESIGLLLLGLATMPEIALLGAAITGAGCSLVFPSLGVEVVNRVPAHVRGTAIGGFSAFQDIAYAATGPLTGLLATPFGYPVVFIVAASGTLIGVMLLLPALRGDSH